MSKLDDFLKFIECHNGIGDKGTLARLSSESFALIRDRSIYYCDQFAVRFSQSRSTSFSNTILSLSNLKKIDHLPFLVCLVTPTENLVFIANSTFLRKISHSSQTLAINNIRGSFNGSDITRCFERITNESSNIRRLFEIHRNIGFDENLPRLVDATKGINPSGRELVLSEEEQCALLCSPDRAKQFLLSDDFKKLKGELDNKVKKFKDEILIAAMIENANVRGRVIEYLIAGDNEAMRTQLMKALRGDADKGPFHSVRTQNSLGDYERNFDEYTTQTDVKTKILLLHSNPKAYNIDKMLQYLTKPKSVFMFYFVGLDIQQRQIKSALISIFQKDLLRATLLLRHWAGRNSRGTSQFDGSIIEALIMQPNNEIDCQAAKCFLRNLINI